jgi:broad specificity phosphatase PhoE
VLNPYASIRLCFVRHGQARAADGFYNELTPLSPVGERQAVVVANELLRGATATALYSSPYVRCIETAKRICEALRLAPRLDARLREFEFENCTLAETLTRPDLVIWDSTHRAKPNGETLAEFSSRVSALLDEIIEEHLGSGVVLVTHSGVIDAAIRWCVGLSSQTPWMHDFALANASITEVEFWPRGRVEGGAPRYATILRIADTGHLVDVASEM